jgi:hypothetical protein
MLRSRCRDHAINVSEDIPLPAKSDGPHTSPKRKRGNNLQASLALRATVISGREPHSSTEPFVEPSKSLLVPTEPAAGGDTWGHRTAKAWGPIP